MTDDIPSLIERLRAWKSLRACDFEENSPLAEDLEAAAQALQQQAREIESLRETLAGMHCPRQLNAGTIADCTGRLECGCNAGAVFVKTGASQK